MLKNFIQRIAQIVKFFDGFTLLWRVFGYGILLISIVYGLFIWITNSDNSIYLTVIVFLVLLIIFLLYYIWNNIYKLQKFQILDPNVRLLTKEFDCYINFDGSYRYEESTKAVALIDRYQFHFDRFAWTGDRGKTKTEIGGNVSELVIDEKHSRYTYMYFHMDREYAKGEEFELNYAITVYDSEVKKSEQYFSYRSDRSFCNNAVIRVHFPAKYQGDEVNYTRHVGTTHGLAVQTQSLKIAYPSIRDGFYHVLIQVTDNRYIHKLNFENLEQLPAD